MEKENINGQMDLYIMEIGFKERYKDMAVIDILMVDNIKVVGRII